jgi:hypothetical protein
VPYNYTGRSVDDSSGRVRLCQAGGARRKVACTPFTFGCRPSVVPPDSVQGVRYYDPALVRDM